MAVCGDRGRLSGTPQMLSAAGSHTVGPAMCEEAVVDHRRARAIGNEVCRRSRLDKG